ncbi:MAG: peptidylprolyl isomerase [Betaproteobacteria bacterium]
MAKIALLTVVLMVIAGCATDELRTVRTHSTVEETLRCNSENEVKIRVFHSMYKDKKSAEHLYSKIMANPSEDNLAQLMAAARSDSMDMASRKSGGDLGYIQFGELDKEFEARLFNLPLKTLSNPVTSRWGWHLIWVSEAINVKTGKPCQWR